MTTIPSAVTLILSDARGIYIPRDFLTDDYNEIDTDHCAAWGLNEENADWWKDALTPDSEYYWDAWHWILDNARYTDERGNVYHLYQDGNLWALCYERMTSEEKHNFDMNIEPHEYFINLDERGNFYADVRNPVGNTIFEIHGIESLYDIGMKDRNDVKTLQDFLVGECLMSEYDELIKGQ